MAAATVTFAKLSAYQNLSDSLKQCGTAKGGTVEHLACALKCQAHEGALQKAFEPWWDHRLPSELIQQACKRAEFRYSLAFIGAIVDGFVLYKCCSSQHEEKDECDGGGTHLQNGKEVRDNEMLLFLLGEIAAAVKLPNMYFVFNTGDQPFTDKPHWTPIPQLQWVRSQGHWTIPLPNPFHLRAHIDGRLGNNAMHSHHVTWSKKIPKVFWRGSLSFPDTFQVGNIDVVPRMRLQKLAQQHPSLFNIAIVNMDFELEKFSKDELESLYQRLITGPHIDNMCTTLPKYKYLINVPAVCPHGGLLSFLLQGLCCCCRMTLTMNSSMNG